MWAAGCAVSEGVGMLCAPVPCTVISSSRDLGSRVIISATLPRPCKVRPPAPPALSFSLVIFAIAPLDGRVELACTVPTVLYAQPYG